MSRRYRPGTLILGLAVVLAVLVTCSGCAAPKPANDRIIEIVELRDERTTRDVQNYDCTSTFEVLPTNRVYLSGRVERRNVEILRQVVCR